MPSKNVMKNYKAGKRHSGSKKGPKVKNRKQAIAIMLSEKRKESKGAKALNLPVWSYGFLSELGNCPHKAFRKHVAKDLPKEQHTPEQQRGIDVHKGAEDYIASRGATPAPDSTMQQYLDWFIGKGAQAEVQVAMREDGSPCGYWDADCWGRSKIDVLIPHYQTACLWDWKTGKPREDPRELAVQAMMLQAEYPNIQTIFGQYIWLKTGELGKLHNLSATERCYRGTKASMDQAAGYLKQGHWPKTPNPLCGWCNVRDCEHNRSP